MLGPPEPMNMGAAVAMTVSALDVRGPWEVNNVEARVPRQRRKGMFPGGWAQIHFLNLSQDRETWPHPSPYPIHGSTAEETQVGVSVVQVRESDNLDSNPNSSISSHSKASSKGRRKRKNILK